MPYNEAGNYHDGIMVWHEQAIVFYAILAIASIVLNIAIVMLYRKSIHNENI